MPPERRRNDGEIRYAFSWPVAAVLIVAMLLVGGGWLGLVFAGLLPVDSGIKLASHVFALLVGAGVVPLGKLYRRKQVDFKISPSDPPEGPDSGEDSDGAT